MSIARIASLSVAGLLRNATANTSSVGAVFGSVLGRQPRRTLSTGLDISSELDSFERRHISGNVDHINQMLKTLGLESLEDLVQKTVPENIRLNRELDFDFEAEGESKALQTFKSIMSKNKVLKSYLGLGYYSCHTPPVILRNILENPLWYTPYTPYQAEISQGRLESLLNFQTLVSDLTGLPNANASLLDEATAGAEAMTFCLRSSSSTSKSFFVAHDVLPQTIELIKTRAEPIGVDVIVGDYKTFDFVSTPVFGAVVQYPNVNGEIHDYTSFINAAHETNALVCVETDLLALTLLKPPGEFGADVAFGSAQRFGIPLGYGGPHAAFFAIANQKESRKVPGRIIGVSKTVDGKAGYRLALQTREQHIRREKATSNICTAQALLANISAMYAIYHGPEGLKNIARRVHHLTFVLHQGLSRLGHSLPLGTSFFDTITVRPRKTTADHIITYARLHNVNLRKVDHNTISISLDETTTESDVDQLFDIFNNHQPRSFSASSIASSVASSSALIESSAFQRTSSFLTHPIFNSFHTEHELLRYIHRLSSKDLSLATSMISLGSCTMKLNATSEMIPVTWPEVGALHPFAPLEQTLGYQQMFNELDQILSEITGFAKISFQPNAGSQGEYAGLMTIRKYLQSIGQGHRDICLIPSSAHGTNPASANMAGMKIEVVDCDADGYINLDSLRSKATANADRVAAVMVTYPSTFGIFEETIKQVCDIIHGVGGQVYLDGANMNAMVGLCRPGDIGADVCHLNLHKTFCIPHGGGGPGMGPIGVAQHLVPFLPQHPFLNASPSSTLSASSSSSSSSSLSSSSAATEERLGPISASPWASASILPITWMYTRMMGAKGVANASKVAILNANYMRKRLEPYYHIRFISKNGFCAHEFIVDINPFKKTANIEVTDVAKRLMDFNFHSPTMSWPVPGTLMIEPTESETKAELDRFCDALIQIHHEIQEIEKGVYPKTNNVLKNAPHTADCLVGEWDRPYPREKAVFPLPWVRSNKFWPSVSRIDNAFGDTHLVCSCPPIESYSQ